MSVKIRLRRRGRKKRAEFDVVIADARGKRDGAYIEKIGKYNVQSVPAEIEINETSVLDWLLKGAQPTPTVRAILSHQGILLKKHLQVGVKKKAISQEQANSRYDRMEQRKRSPYSLPCEKSTEIR